MPVPSLSIDELARSVGVNRKSPHALFLGAGASLTSGMPTAASCVSEWKRSIYLSNNPLLRHHVTELSLPSVKKRIDDWLRANGFWPLPDCDDYGYFIEKCHPIADDRRRCFEPWIRASKPHVGYQLLCLLAESELFRSVWTTNFDGLAAKAAALSSISVVEVGIDSTDRCFRQPSRSELICVSLHGDYRYDKLANTPEELRAQESQLKHALIETLKTHSLIVSGYSGRDASVMEALHEAVARNAGPTKLYWCDVKDDPSPPVAALIDEARRVGREAFFVPNASFDDVMVRLATICTDGEMAQRASSIIGSAETSTLPNRQAFSLNAALPTAVIKSNALPVRLPSEVFAFDLIEWPQEKVWQWLAEKAEPHTVLAAPFRQVLAFGTLDGIRAAFEGCIKGPIQRVPIDDRELRMEEGAVISLLQQALICGIAAKLGLATDGRRRLWETTPCRTESHDGRKFNVHRSVNAVLRSVGHRVCLTLDPTYFVPICAPEDELAIANIVKGLLGYQHNNEYNEALEHWRKTLCQNTSDPVYDYPPSSAAFEFTLSRIPLCAAITAPRQRTIEIAEKWQPVIQHRGIECEEPNLLFGVARNGQAIVDTMPIRGLAQHGPYDQIMTADADRVRISVICPKAEAGLLESFLAGAESRVQSLRQEKEEYLVPYPGFQAAFRLPLQMPNRRDVNWFTLPEIDSSRSPQAGARELARNIKDAIQSANSIERSVVLILTPTRWDHWRAYETADEAFDVHDFVKAYAVQRGIATQFLKQEKLTSQEKCRLWWWLSVALYAKAMRTPWVLQGLDANTAYVGLGYAIDTKGPRGQHIVLGCSHLYNSQGQGLQFRLSRIENATIRGGNPYLSFDDSRKMGDTIRSLFWDSHQRLPDRVVVHKLFPFRLEEQKGLRVGLDGVKELELLEINHEARLRYLSSRFVNGNFAGDSFPVRRGTTLKLTDHEALLWVHGATSAVKPNWTYFQGKRRIPAPVLIRRYAGTSSLSTIASEILGLSKMDWNSGDLYSQLPATVHSSKTIARIGSLLERFGSESYDYRLFM